MAARVAYLTQTTLAIDETDALVDRLRERFTRSSPGPAADDICYATQNRQEAIATIAGSATSCSWSARRTRRTRTASSRWRAGPAAPPTSSRTSTEIDPGWLAGAVHRRADRRRVGTRDLSSTGWSTAIAGLGPVEVEERAVTSETVQFNLPAEVRPVEVRPVEVR